MASWRIFLLRLLASLTARIDRTLCFPIPPGPSYTITVPRPSKSNRTSPLNLIFYLPPNHSSKTPVPFVLNFHGGGYTLGAAADDARWAHYVTSRLGMVFVSVEYGLAPEHPLPHAVDDGVDALEYLWALGAELGLDVERTVTSGNSAGGTLGLAVPIRVHEKAKARGRNGDVGEGRGRICGTVSFYPGVDWTQTREEREASNPLCKEKSAIPLWLLYLFDEAYLGPHGKRPDMSSPLLSPGKAEDGVLREALPGKMALYSCEWDQLLVEEETFRKRLRGLGKEVGGFLVNEEPHAWDKKPSFWWGDAKRDEMFKDAVRNIVKMIEL